MPAYTKSKEGYHFEPTELGNSIPKVYGKYATTFPTSKVYVHNVPSVWVKEGWVKEVKDGEK